MPGPNSPPLYIFTDKPTLTRLLPFIHGLSLKKVSVRVTDKPPLGPTVAKGSLETVSAGSAATDNLHRHHAPMGGHSTNVGSRFPWAAGRQAAATGREPPARA